MKAAPGQPSGYPAGGAFRALETTAMFCSDQTRCDGEACAVLDSLPDLSKPLAKADPELRRSVYEAFQFGIELDRNKPEIRLKALVSSAFSTISDLDDLAGMVANGVIAGAGHEHLSATGTAHRIEEIWSF